MTIILVYNLTSSTAMLTHSMRLNHKHLTCFQVKLSINTSDLIIYLPTEREDNDDKCTVEIFITIFGKNKSHSRRFCKVPWETIVWGCL
jgi:hypothetical protein